MRRGKEGISVAKQHVPSQVLDPLADDLLDVLSDREEPGRKGLRELGLHLPRVLNDLSLLQIHVLESERGERTITNSRQQRERNDSTVAQFKVPVAGHGANDVEDLIQGGDESIQGCLGDSAFLFG